MVISAIILAAGASSRMGSDKMLASLCGKSTVQRSIEAILSGAAVDEIIIAASEKNIEEIKEAARCLKNCTVIIGGKTRGESSYKALLKAKGDYVLIHDGARPLVQKETVQKTLAAAIKYGAAAPGCVPKDTIKKVDGGFISETIERKSSVIIQTPQAFSREKLISAYEMYGMNETDDCALVEKMGLKVKVVEGSYENIKLTTPEDILLAENIIDKTYNKERSAFVRVGTGFDTHRLEYGRKLVLGGVEIEYEKGLMGHSDADVLIHAVTDALFGAAALGDIGSHFPDSDEKYKGISSILLLKEATELLRENGFVIENVDTTIIAQSPKMAPYINSMRENLANAMNIDVKRVSVKAKTNENMGFTGRGEGIEARAAVLISSVTA